MNRTHETRFHKILRCVTASGGWTSGNYYLLCKSDLDAEFLKSSLAQIKLIA